MFADKRTAPDRKSVDGAIEREACATAFGNAFDVLARGPEDDAEAKLAGALAAFALHDASGEEIVWLAAHTPFDALPWIEKWDAIIEAARGKVLDRAEKLIAYSALARSKDEDARRAAAEAGEPLLSVEASAASFSGQIVSAPRRAWATVVLGLTGLLFVIGAARLVARYVLSYQTPGMALFARDAVTLKWKVKLLGRTLRDRNVVIVREALATVTREVRFPSAHLYVGLGTLAIGSWFGMSLVVDGLRAWSSSLLGAGLLVAAAGIAIDFVLVSVIPGTRGKCRVIVRPRRGPSLCVELADADRADAAIARLK